MGNDNQGRDVRASENKGNDASSRVEEEVVELIPTEMSDFMRHDPCKYSEGASTPGHNGFNG
ncbi:hypothetical protein Hanom_Chr01g00047441 [Helianthus anomalus]